MSGISTSCTASQAVNNECLSLSRPHEFSVPGKPSVNPMSSNVEVLRGPLVNQPSAATPGIAETLVSLVTLLMSLVESLQNSLLGDEKRTDQKTTVNSNNNTGGIHPVNKEVPVVNVKSERISGISGRPVGEKPTDVWHGVTEGVKHTSHYLSGIKAAMEKYGQSPLGIYKSVTESADAYVIEMRDGYKVTLTKKELEHARLALDFRGTDPGMIQDAKFMYAVTAKRVQDIESSAYTRESFEWALESMGDSLVLHGLERLGLGGQVRPVTWQELEAKGGIGVVGVGDHGSLMKGGYVDMFGPSKLKEVSTYGHGGLSFTHRAFELI
ncbi:hypothetical protein HX875_29950 [Pseudomonas yamanorum]|uniref:Uncharacterized protein n=1 Tax=Pseudomonas yamanorum TaxID=515393 RepID=A0A7Y8F8T8_9PSED|nr:hypothetical protein [Pseudomonas yamanorum]NVZ81388.1 hypothetical protein [Pseudomonas yamanorum]NWE43731.1 hypothetical protein [Pseudomonas yamanorum]NWE74808.1 hypothetical protein [Pseudomonas yamanorum]